jgi:hypothetical protein
MNPAATTARYSLRAFFAQAGASSIYDDVVYEGQSIEMERLWLWVARNIPGLSSSHRDAVKTEEEFLFALAEALREAETRANGRRPRSSRLVDMPLRAISCGRQMRPNCPQSWSSTKIVASTHTLRMWRGGWRSPISSHSHQMG